MKKSLALSFMLTTALLLANSAHATTIDFEDRTGPSTFAAAGNAQTLTYGIATFTGGVILTGESAQTTDNSSVYGTRNENDLTNPLIINFSQAVQNFSFQILNAIAGDYQITYNGGTTTTFNLATTGGSIQNESLGGVGTQIAIQFLGPALGDTTYDFAIDNVSFDVANVSAVPLPAALPMFGAALMGLGAVRRRKA